MTLFLHFRRNRESGMFRKPPSDSTLRRYPEGLSSRLYSNPEGVEEWIDTSLYIIRDKKDWKEILAGPEPKQIIEIKARPAGGILTVGTEPFGFATYSPIHIDSKEESFSFATYRPGTRRVFELAHASPLDRVFRMVNPEEVGKLEGLVGKEEFAKFLARTLAGT
jgi:hypothetical protein